MNFDFMNVIYAILVLGVMGAVFGILLAVAAKVFEVEKDPRFDSIVEILPGANCGGCGYAGCSAYAQAVIDGTASLSACSAGGSEVTQKISEIMGTEAEAAEKYVAFIKCSGGSRANQLFCYEGVEDCVAAALVQGGSLECKYGCLGFGTCAAACPFDAINMADGVAVVDREKCTGCMSCAKKCPRGLIDKIPYKAEVMVACSSCDKGAVARKLCEVSCIGCKICEKACEFDAIKVENNIAEIDYEKCTFCGKCAEKCPRKCINSLVSLQTGSEESAAETAEV